MVGFCPGLSVQLWTECRIYPEGVNNDTCTELEASKSNLLKSKQRTKGSKVKVQEGQGPT